ncbi:MAG: thioredoxin domain-containing protein [Gemmatimonadetes bacterium]|nr:thioredoxin domain-containing protein [Gemmatimonadota bacterium]
MATILILLFGPMGPLRRWYTDLRAASEQRALVASSWNELVSLATVIANEPAPSDTVAMFTDYQCPFCRSIEPALVQAVDGGLAIALLHLPLDLMHPRARDAASAAVCAEEHGVFQEVHHGLMSTDEWMDDGMWENFVQEVGAPDVPALIACMESERTSDRLTESTTLAGRLGIRGTPTFVTKEGVESGVDGLASVLAQVGTTSR